MTIDQKLAISLEHIRNLLAIVRRLSADSPLAGCMDVEELTRQVGAEEWLKMVDLDNTP